MRGRTSGFLILTATISVLVMAGRNSTGAPPKPTTQPAATESRGPMTTLGHELIANLPPVKFGIHNERFLEAQRDDKPFATSRSSLVSKGVGEEIRYHYQDISLFRSDDRSVIEVKTTGVLNRRFRPESIEWEIINQAPNGLCSTTMESLTIDDEEMLHIKKDATGKTTEKRIPAPKVEFVYLIDDLIQLLNVESGQRFILSDLDPETGRLNRRTYEISKQDGNQTRVGIRKLPSKVETEYYLLREPGTIVRHDVFDPPISFTATTKTRVLAIEEAFRRLRR